MFERFTDQARRVGFAAPYPVKRRRHLGPVAAAHAHHAEHRPVQLEHPIAGCSAATCSGLVSSTTGAQLCRTITRATFWNMPADTANNWC